jgi:50S ribosomal subunit-associated GTPase HflX
MAEVMDARSTSLETLAERIDRAVQAIARLKTENAKLTTRLKELESGNGELGTLKAAERAWTTERKEIAHRIEELVAKLDKLDA